MKRPLKYAPTALFLAFTVFFTFTFFALPKAEFSEKEKSKLASLPSLDAQSLLNGKASEGFDDYLSDHFPFRDMFVGLQSYYELFTGRGGVAEVYLSDDGYLITAEAAEKDKDGKPQKGKFEKAVRTNVKNYAAFAQKMGLDASLLIVPQAGYSMDNKLPAVHLPYHDDLFFAAAAEECGDMQFIDVRDALRGGDGLYYKTDHHLTMDGAQAVYRVLAAEKGFSPQEQYTVESYDGFYGTSYAKSGYWASSPDSVALFKSELNDNVTVSISPNGTDPLETYSSLFFEDHLQNMDKYPVYLNGNQGLVTIHNPDAPEGKLLVVKDSYSHSVMTLLCQHYRDIVMVDLRYYSGSARSTIHELVTQYGLSEALFLYGADTLSTDSSPSFNLFQGIEEALPE